MTPTDLDAEQAYLDYAYERLAAMRSAAADLRDYMLADSRGGTHQARYERDVFVETGLRRLDQLDIGNESLVFGRIDQAEDATHYIGRRAVAGPNQESVVVDWRAPAAEAFYRATGRQPLGLVRRRHFFCAGRRLVHVEDERFAEGDDADGELGLAGPGALLAALERTRTGRMRDIVATIQGEQDEIIRADLPGVLAVQGGPGTGKTAVALHRAAYLLFTHRRQLGRQGMLVIGPNPLFLRYIDQVLPALGESGVELRTVDGLIDGVRARAVDSRESARVKSDFRMIEFVARAARDRQRPLRHDVTIPVGPYRLVLRETATREVVAAARRRAGTHNQRRRTVERLVSRRLYHEYRAAARATGHARSITPRDLTRELHHERAFRDALDRMWPVLSPQELLHDLFGAPPLVALAGRGLLSADEQAVLHRPRSSRLEDVAWTSADLALLDEASVHLGPLQASRAGADGEEPVDDRPVYGHIVVDEVQDLSPIQLRMVGRGSLNGSLTLVGDLAQATGPWAPVAWDDILAHLPTKRGTRLVELSVNYRTPAEIMDLARRVLEVSAPHIAPPRSVRETGELPVLRRVRAWERPGLVAAQARHEREATGGTVAVISPPSLLDELRSSLGAAGVEFGEATRDGLDQPITLVPINVVKGLEFDAVVVVEPRLIIAEAPQGRRALYVALTRATRHLAIVHADDLPPELA